MNSNEGTTKYGVTLVEHDNARDIIREPAFFNHGVWDCELCRWVPGYNVWTDKRTFEECRIVAQSTKEVCALVANELTTKHDICLDKCQGCPIKDECPVNPSRRSA